MPDIKAATYRDKDVAEPPDAASKPSLKRNFSATVVGNVLYAACQWAMLVALAKMGNPVMVGKYVLGLAVTAPIILAANLQLASVQASDARREYAFGHYLGLRLLTTILALAVTGAVVAASGYQRETALVVLIVAAMKACDAISDVMFGLLQQREQMLGIAAGLILNGVVSLAALVVALHVTHNVVWAAAGSGLGSLMAAAYNLRSGARVLRAESASGGGPTSTRQLLAPRWEARRLQHLAALALPLGVAMLLTTLSGCIPRYIIQHSLGEGELGIFGALAYVMTAGRTVINAMGQAATPRMARHHAAGETAAFTHMLVRLFGFGAIIGAAGIAAAAAAGRGILSLLYTPEYAAATHVFTLMMVVAAIQYVVSFMGDGMTAARLFKPQVPLCAGVSAATLIAGLVLIPRFGLTGAAWASIISVAVELIGRGGVLLFALARHTGATPAAASA
ncbi:MAG TPA: oligosaccharide flippase family protein [Armatimonadota bacterium]|jgi:O-antigen/teichoic acid export membrane protein